MFRRVTDNSKILRVAGMKQSELNPLFEGLREELERTKDYDWEKYAESPISIRMDKYLSDKGID